MFTSFSFAEDVDAEKFDLTVFAIVVCVSCIFGLHSLNDVFDLDQLIGVVLRHLIKLAVLND